MNSKPKASPIQVGGKQVLGTFTISGSSGHEQFNNLIKKFDVFKGREASIEEIERIFGQGGGTIKITQTIQSGSGYPTTTTTTKTIVTTKTAQSGKLKENIPQAFQEEWISNNANTDMWNYEQEPQNDALDQMMRNQRQRNEKAEEPKPAVEVRSRRPPARETPSETTKVEEKKETPVVEIPPPPVYIPVVEPKQQKVYTNLGPKELQVLKDAIKMQFVKESEKMIPGKSSTEKGGKAGGPSIKEPDCIDGFGLVSLFYQNSCYTDGRYNNNNYNVEKGRVAGNVAFKVYPPTTKFKEFLASEHCIAFSLTEAVPHTVYRLDGNTLDIAAEIPAAEVNTSDYTLVKAITVSNLIKPMAYICRKSSQTVSPLHRLNDKAEGAVVHRDKNITVQLVNFQIPKDPMTPQLFVHGPDSHYNCYNPNRDIFRLQSTNTEAIVWGDAAKESIYLTHIDRSTCTIKCFSLETMPNFQLAAATGDDSFVYYVIAEKGESNDKTATRKLFMIKANLSNGKKVKQQALPTDKSNLNIFHFDACQLALSAGMIGMIVSRKMTRSQDGLNHQGACAAVFDAQTLKLKILHGQTSGHSFAHSLFKRSDGVFTGYDLGDNYPRAVHHWNFTSSNIEFKQVYSFKTDHGSEPKSPAGVSYPVYTQISNAKKKYYKWSNDNRTYTELGAPGVVQSPSGMLIFFAGENMPSPLDSSKTGNYNNCPRNLGFVKVSKDLCYGPGIISEGPEEKGGFFTFQGAWSVQVNKGISWLTNLEQGQNVSRLKTASFSNNNIFILYECWDKTNYINTQYVIVNSDGKVLVRNTVIPIAIRVHKSDDMYWDGDSVILYAGSRGKVLKRYSIKPTI